MAKKLFSLCKSNIIFQTRKVKWIFNKSYFKLNLQNSNILQSLFEAREVHNLVQQDYYW